MPTTQLALRLPDSAYGNEEYFDELAEKIGVTVHAVHNDFTNAGYDEFNVEISGDVALIGQFLLVVAAANLANAKTIVELLQQALYLVTLAEKRGAPTLDSINDFTIATLENTIESLVNDK